jgi:DNA topoisomerase IB
MAKRSQQLQVPGTEREKIPELQEAAENYRAFRDEEIETGEKAKAAKVELIRLMKVHGRSVFSYVDEDGNERRVDLSTKENAKVKKIAARGDDSPHSTSSGAGTDGGGGVEVH